MGKWTLVTTMVSRDGTRGHRIFRNEDAGRLAIADNSGSTPDSTEDGVLWIESIGLGDSYIEFRLSGARQTHDDLTEANAYSIARTARAFSLKLEGTSYIGKLVAKDVL